MIFTYNTRTQVTMIAYRTMLIKALLSLFAARSNCLPYHTMTVKTKQSLYDMIYIANLNSLHYILLLKMFVILKIFVCWYQIKVYI
jgi:hypothetical protein